MSEKPTAAAAKKRYKILKRCDQNDPEVKSEVAQLEDWYPELKGEVKQLSAATRATLEGGALVTTIEEKDEQQKKNATNDDSEGNNVSQEEDEVKKKLQELNEMTQRLLREQQKQDEENKKEEGEGEKELDDEFEHKELTEKQKAELRRKKEQQEAKEQREQQELLLQQAASAMKIYDAVYHFTDRCVVSKFECFLALCFGVLAACYHVIGFAVEVPSYSSSSSSSSPSSSTMRTSAPPVYNTLCDSKAALTNPVAWVGAIIFARAMMAIQNSSSSSSSDEQQQQKAADSDNNSKSGKIPSLILLLISLASALVRFIFAGILCFTIYSLVTICLIGVYGSQISFPARFCNYDL